MQFNTDSMETTQAILSVAAEMRAPIIIGVGQAAAKDGKIEPIAAMVKEHVERTKMPICLHLDHSRDVAQIRRAVDAGFSSVMIDGSALPLDENIQLTLQAISIGHPAGVSVEAELGKLPGQEDNTDVALAESEKVSVSSVVRFTSEVQPDALAVAIGSAHGFYSEEPKLDFDLLTQVTEVTDVPLVLHGGSGIPDAALKEAFSRGVKKLNISTEIRHGFRQGLCDGVMAGEGIYEMFERGRSNVRRLVRQKLEISGSVGMM